MPTRVLLIGAGSIGAFFGSRLATVPNVLVSALCRSNYKAVKTNGFKITSPYFGDYSFKPEFAFASPDEATGKGLKWDYLLIATKALPEVSDDSVLLDGLVGDETAIVLMQNGINVEAPYHKRFPRATILTSTTNASVAQPEPGWVKHNRWTKIAVGPYLPPPSTTDRDTAAMTKNAEFLGFLEQGEINDADAYNHADMQFVRWHKVAINAAMNPSSVLSGGCGNQALSTDPDLAHHTKQVMIEVLDIAPKILGKSAFPMEELKLPTPEQVLDSVSKNTSGSRPSMWQDWEKGSKMELEVILGNPVRMAREKGLEMPRLQAMYALLKSAQERREKESKQKGKL